MNHRTLTSLISCAFFLSALQAQDRMKEPNLLPIGIVANSFDRYWRNDAGHETLEKLKNDDGRSWFALERNEFACSVRSERPIMNEGKLLIPLEAKERLLVYFKIDGIKPSHWVTSFYDNTTAKPYFSDAHRMASYVDPKKDAINKAPRKPFPDPLNLGGIKLSIESDKKNIRFLVQNDNQRQIIEQQTLAENTIFTVLWAGDIDQDGKTDLIYEYMQDYGDGISGHLKLLLSSLATTGELMHSVGSFNYYNGG